MTANRVQSGSDVAAADNRSAFLRLALKADAVASTAAGALLLLGGSPLSQLLGAPAGFLRPVGAFLIVYAAAIWYVGTRGHVSRAAVWSIIALNLLWLADSVVVLAAGWFAWTALGTAFVVVQAAVVAVFADLQYLGLRRMGQRREPPRRSSAR